MGSSRNRARHRSRKWRWRTRGRLIKRAGVQKPIPGMSADTIREMQHLFKAVRNGIEDAKNVSLSNAELKKLLNFMEAIVELGYVAGEDVQKPKDNENSESACDSNLTLVDCDAVSKNTEDGTPIKPVVSLTVSEPADSNDSWTATTATYGPARCQSLLSYSVAKNVGKPQSTFEDIIDNSKKLWYPQISDKPNSLNPPKNFPEDVKNPEAPRHPWADELNEFVIPQKQLTKIEPVDCKSLDNTLLIFIVKPEDVKILCDDLSHYDEIAVDTKHHYYRTFQGLTCLMHISTRDTDYLIDTIALRSHLHVLNRVFTKPTILKVFHDARTNLTQLQRDLSIYVVNMFDTHRAAKLLDRDCSTVKYLMKKYCNVEFNEHYRLADWRVRPLPEELVKHARDHTHHLLRIKDSLVNDLIDADRDRLKFMKIVYDYSTEVCKRIYAKPIWNEDSCNYLCEKYGKNLDKRQLWALRELHRWRDSEARYADESCSYLMTDHELINVAKKLPIDNRGIFACCYPTTSLFQRNIFRLNKIVLRAREVPRDDDECVSEAVAPQENASYEASIDRSITIANESSDYDDDDSDERQMIVEKMNALLASTFSKYKCLLPMSEAEERSEREQDKNKDEDARSKDIEIIEQEQTTNVTETVREPVESTKNVDEIPKYVWNFQKRKKLKKKVVKTKSNEQLKKREIATDELPNHTNDSRDEIPIPKTYANVNGCESNAKKHSNELSNDSEIRKKQKYECSTMNDSQNKVLNPSFSNKNKPNKFRNLLPDNGSLMRNEQLTDKRLNIFASSLHNRNEPILANIRDLLHRGGVVQQKNYSLQLANCQEFPGRPKIRRCFRVYARPTAKAKEQDVSRKETEQLEDKCNM